MTNNEFRMISKSTHKELDRLFKERGNKILERYKRIIISDVHNKELLAVLNDVNRYWKDNVRPILTLLSCEAVGGGPQLAEDAGLMFSLASSGFGIHDDIIDNSSFKHFRKTIFGIHGIDSALLVGDLLIVKAWSILDKMIRKTTKPIKIADLVRVYGK